VVGGVGGVGVGVGVGCGRVVVVGAREKVGGRVGLLLLVLFRHCLNRNQRRIVVGGGGGVVVLVLVVVADVGVVGDVVAAHIDLVV